MKNALVAGVSPIALHCAGRVDRWCCRNCRYVQVVSETDQARAQRVQRKQKKELRALAERISTHGRTVHHRYPTGDVVVSEHDLAASAWSKDRLSSSQDSARLLAFLQKRVVVNSSAGVGGRWQQLRKRPDVVATALNILLGERKLQKAPLSAYWKLNV
jgi:hypothetical protein